MYVLAEKKISNFKTLGGNDTEGKIKGALIFQKA